MPSLSCVSISSVTKLPCGMSTRYGEKIPRNRRAVVGAVRCKPLLADAALALSVALIIVDAVDVVGAVALVVAGAGEAARAGPSINGFFDAQPAIRAVAINAVAPKRTAVRVVVRTSASNVCMWCLNRLSKSTKAHMIKQIPMTQPTTCPITPPTSKPAD